ncbi:MAG: SDR family oxidoreductase [Planctomycetota bacterium]|jgi:2-deoxy-D-gluconate 3-dehydrogenase|nr:SDR family oxidoreductase [Planctomycetota bacterium]
MIHFGDDMDTIYDLFRIDGKKAIVTGGAKGLGRSMAEALVEAGCEVAVIGSSDACFRTAAELTARGPGTCAAARGDFLRREEVYSSFEKSLKLLGGDVDILITAAGIQRRHLAENFPVGDWDDILRVNLDAVFICCQLAGRIMLAKGRGKIINISSMVAHFGGQTVPAYTASKAGVTQLTRELSNDWLGRGVNVNAIAPGYMHTDMCDALVKDPVRGKQILDRIPAGRWGKPEDLKGTTIFLSSRASDYLGGAIIPVDGGYLVK